MSVRCCLQLSRVGDEMLTTVRSVRRLFASQERVRDVINTPPSQRRAGLNRVGYLDQAQDP